MITFIKYNLRVILFIAGMIFLFITDIAEAQYGHMHRATRRRTAIVVHEHDKEVQEEQAAQAKDSTQTQQQTENQQATSTTPPPPVTESPNGELPIGTVVSALPEGCVSKPVDNVEYYQCGPNYYKVAYQGNNIVYVTTDPPKQK